jgi:hypothetical protein
MNSAELKNLALVASLRAEMEGFIETAAAFREIVRQAVELEKEIESLRLASHLVPKCSVPDDHIDPRRSALFMARSILREVREGVGAC